MSDELITMPHSPESEAAVIGACLIEREALERASELLLPSDFYMPKWRKVFGVMLDLYRKNEPVDLVSLPTALRERDLLEEVGGFLTLKDALDGCPTAAGIVKFAATVLSRSTARSLMTAADRIKAMAGELAVDPDAMCDTAEKLIAEVKDRGTPEDFESARLSRLIHGEYARMARENKEKAVPGVLTNVPALNDLLQPGLQPGTLMVVAGLPSAGKTLSAMYNFALPAGAAGKSVLVISLEMKAASLARRCMVALSGTPTWQIMNQDYRRNNWEVTQDHGRDVPISEDFGDVLSRVGDWNVFIKHIPGLTPQHMQALIRRKERDGGLDLVIVDGLWLMNSNERFGTTREKFMSIMHSVANSTHGGRIPVILLHQLARPPEDKRNANWMPTLQSLAETAAIEQDADYVLFCHRPAYFNPEPNPDEDCQYKLYLAKNRESGRTGVVDTHFSRAFGRIDPIDKYRQEDAAPW